MIPRSESASGTVADGWSRGDAATLGVGGRRDGDMSGNVGGPAACGGMVCVLALVVESRVGSRVPTCGAAPAARPSDPPGLGLREWGTASIPNLGAVLDVKSLKWSSEPTLVEAPLKQVFSLSLSRSLSETASAVRNGGSGSGCAVEPSRPL